MPSDKHPPLKSFTPFSTAAEEVAMRSVQDTANQDGHMSSTAGRVKHEPGADLPFVVTLTHHKCEATEHPFATMREAEAFIEQSTPVPRPALSSLYDRPASDFGAPQPGESGMNDENILARLKVIDQRLRKISSEDAASVLASGLTSAGIHEQERLRLIAETERILDELDGKNND